MRKLTGLLVLALVWVAIPAAVAGAGPLPGLECGQTITTSVRLRHDLICPQRFLVTAPYNGTTPLTPITVDLGGHTLGLATPSTSPTCAYYGFYPRGGFSCPITSGTGVMLTIVNGTVAGSVGSTDGSVHLSLVHVQGSVILSDSYALLGDGADRVSDSHIDGGVYDLNSSASIQRNLISGGVRTDDTFVGQHVMITDNLITDSPTAGITIGVDYFTNPDVGGTIANNTITRSTGPGIDAGGSNLAGLLIERNWLLANGADGIELGPTEPNPASAIITGNVAIANAGHGFWINSTAYEAGPPGVLAPPDQQPHFVDGGHNIALFNRNTPQCIGVTCAPSDQRRTVGAA